MCACFVLLLSISFFFFFGCCLLYSLSLYSVLSFFLRVYLLCVCVCFFKQTTSSFRSVEFFVFGKFNNWRFDDLLSIHTNHRMECYYKISRFLSFFSCGFVFSASNILNRSALRLDKVKIREEEEEKAKKK